jgi:hypothetical protein
VSGQAVGAEYAEISRRALGVASPEEVASISGILFTPPLPPTAYLITAVNKLYFVIKRRQIT